MTTTTPRPHLASSRPSTILRLAPWVAGTWALTFLGLAGLALLGRVPHPLTPAEAAPLGGLSAAQLSVVTLGLAVLVLLSGWLALAARSPARTRVAGWSLVVLGILVAVVLSDVRALAFLGYLPMILLATLGLGPGAGRLDWQVVTDSAAALADVTGGLAIAVTGVLVLDRAARSAGRTGLDWSSWARWGKPAVVVAVICPLSYAVTRVAWALDIPLGVSRTMLDELGSMRYTGLGLALFAIVGAWLTTGLVARWGERFWPWLPVLGGRPVPIAMAVVPGLLVATAALSGGLSFWRLLLGGALTEVPGATTDWAAWAPEVLWPLWGMALAVACLAYLGRRRTSV